MKSNTYIKQIPLPKEGFFFTRKQCFDFYADVNKNRLHVIHGCLSLVSNVVLIQTVVMNCFSHKHLAQALTGKLADLFTIVVHLACHQGTVQALRGG